MALAWCSCRATRLRGFACEYEIERAIKDEGQVLLGWRDVPTDNSGLGDSVKQIEPVIRQVFIGRGSGVMVTDALERKLYVIRKSSGHAIQALELAHGKEFYVPSMSARTVVYKGMLLANQVGTYYKDLQDPRVVSALALVHQRFSTNTFPSWDLAHPFRMICAQRRDQHAARQRQLDTRAPGRDIKPDPRQGSRQAVAADLSTASPTRPRSTTRWSCW